MLAQGMWGTRGGASLMQCDLPILWTRPEENEKYLLKGLLKVSECFWRPAKCCARLWNANFAGTSSRRVREREENGIGIWCMSVHQHSLPPSPSPPTTCPLLCPETLPFLPLSALFCPSLEVAHINRGSPASLPFMMMVPMWHEWNAACLNCVPLLWRTPQTELGCPFYYIVQTMSGSIWVE